MNGGKLLGSGSYGCVYMPHLKCQNQNTTKQAVGKVFDTNSNFEDELKNVQEIQNAIDPQNKFTVPLLGFCDVQSQDIELQSCDILHPSKHSPFYKQIIYKYAGISLHDYITQHKGSVNAFIGLVKNLQPILQGIHTLIEHCFVHGDIKPANIMVTKSKNKLILIDFGFLTHVKDVYVKSRLNILSADYPYFPPEFKLKYSHHQGFDTFYEKVMRNFNANRKVARAFVTVLKMKPKEDLETLFIRKNTSFDASKIDVFSLGIVLLELFLWSGWVQKQYHRKVANAVMRDKVLELIRGMIHFDPVQRFNIDEVLLRFKVIFP